MLKILIPVCKTGEKKIVALNLQAIVKLCNSNNIINVKKILAVITATYAVAKRKPEKKSGLPGFEP